MTTPHDNMTNDYRFAELLEKATELGAQHGRGKDTMVQFGILTVNAAYDGVLDLAKDKHGDGVDDAVKAYAAYSAGSASAVIFDSKSPSGKVQAAKLRSCVRLGTWTRGGQGEPIGAMNKLFAEYHNLRKDPVKAKQLDDAYGVLLKFARFQIKQTAAVDDPQVFRALCNKKQSSTKSLEEYVNGVVKRLEDLAKGKAAHNTLQDNSPVIETAIKGLKQHITDLRKQAQVAASIEAAGLDDTTDTAVTA